ncbi:hypothetical protein [Microbacterium xylanilyticum]
MLLLMQGGGLVVRAAGPRRGRVDPVVQAIREAHVARRDRDVSQWHTEANEAAWSAERASWDAGEDMILTSSELFSDCMFAGLDAEASKHIHATDPEDARLWLVPGLSGGPLVEVELYDGELFDVITGRRIP